MQRITRGLHDSMAKAAVAAVFIGVAAVGVAVPSAASPGGSVGTPGHPVPLQDPTNPSNVDCTTTPADPACAESPGTALTPEFVPPAVPVWPTLAPANQ